jgi:hypothetical protein
MPTNKPEPEGTPAGSIANGKYANVFAIENVFTMLFRAVTIQINKG